MTGNPTRATRWAAGVGEVFAWLLISTGILMAFGWHIPFLGGGLFQGLWIVLIGWFLARGARPSLIRPLAQHALADLPIQRVMRSSLETVDPNLTVVELVQDHMLRSDQRCFPVVGEGRFLGLVCLEDVRRTSQSYWDRVAVKDIMTPADRVRSLSPTEDAAHALDELARLEVDQLPVLDHG